jgi:hypothetical protein
MSFLARTAAIAALFPFLLAAHAQDSKDHDPLFSSNDTLEVRIEAPFKMLEFERPTEEYAAAKFRYKAQGDDEVELDIGIRTRGNLRLRKEICPFPPLRINFEKSQAKDTLFDKQDKLKVVTHCQNNSPRYGQAVVSEYLAYRILNLLTDISFRARLMRITYVYTDSKREIESYAILIEHKERLAKRIDAKVLSVEKTRVWDLRPDVLNLVSVFEYFIANTDFSPLAARSGEDCCHNTALLHVDDAPPYLVVPYDFDQSGLVNAPHASPNPRFRLRSPKDRLYRGRCFNNQQLPASLEQFRAHRGEIEALLNEQLELAAGTRKSALRLIEAFYDVIDRQKRIEREFIKKCI